MRKYNDVIMYRFNEDDTRRIYNYYKTEYRVSLFGGVLFLLIDYLRHVRVYSVDMTSQMYWCYMTT